MAQRKEQLQFLFRICKLQWAESSNTTHDLSVYKQYVFNSIENDRSRHGKAIFQIPGIPFKNKSRFHFSKRFKIIKLAIIHKIQHKTTTLFSIKSSV
jgi:hypothetical protein